jgi:outer membrane protein TolC
MDAARRRAAALALAAAAALACAGDGARYETLRQELARSEPLPTPPGDDLFHGVAVLEREALVRSVLRRNPTLRSAASAWRAALARYPQETALADPRLGMALGPRSFDAAGIDPAWKADLSQDLPFPGKLALRGAVALGEADAAAGDFEAARLQLATMASLLYDDYYLMARTLDVEQHHVALLEELERAALARLEAGEAMLQDPVRAAAELARRRQDRIRFESALRTTAQQLNLLLHRGPDLPLPPPPEDIEPAALPPELDSNADPEALVAAALGARPELRAARGRIASGQAGVDLARREYFPDFTVMAGWDAFWQEGPLQPSVGLQLNLPLQRERRAAAVEEAAAKLARARSDEDSAADEVRFSVRNALERLREARAVLQLQEREILPASRDFVAAARVAFESGEGSFETLLEAERELRTAELDYEGARVAVSRTTAELTRALGRTPGLP